MDNFWLKIANFLGFFETVRKFLEGKKTYLINTIAVVSALAIMFATLGQAMGVLNEMLAKVMLFAGGTLPFPQLYPAVQTIAVAHAGLLATFGAAWAALLQACQNMSKYAQAVRATSVITKAL